MQLKTDRLLVRDFTMDDLDGLWEIFSDRETMAFMQAMTREGTEDFLRSFCVERDPPGAFALISREDGCLAGYVLFNRIDAPGVYELGLVLRRELWGKGLGFEAGRALLDHGFRTLGAHKVMAETEDPARAVSLLERLGMQREGTFRRHLPVGDGQWRDLYWYGLLQEEYCSL